jgi:glycosyltransferase involved in cell wall biosynthesis
MKLLVISAAFPPLKAGEADHALHLCQHLAARGLDVHVLTTKRNIQAGRYSFTLYPIMPDWLWPDLPRLAGFLKTCSPDAVLLIYSDRDYSQHPMITFAPSISKIVLPSVPFVTQLETEYISRKTTIPTRAILKLASTLAKRQNLDYVFGTLLSKSDRLIVLSERHFNRLSNSFPYVDGKGLVIPPPCLMRICPDNNGISRQLGRKALGVKPDDFVVGYYGYVYEEKGIETLFKAFQILNAQRANAKLVMIGGNKAESHSSSYLDGIHELARALGIHAHVRWTGEYPSDSDEASVYLRASDVCVFPFKYGVTLNRSSVAVAAAHGLPIVTTKCEPLESPFRDRENVLLCSPDDPKALARLIYSLIDDENLRNGLRQGATRLAAEHFSWDKAADRTIQALSR